MKILTILLSLILFATPAIAFDFGKCINAINNKVGKVSGYDPRVLTRQCAWATVSKGKGGSYFKKCMVNGMKRNVKNLKDPEGFVNNIWNSIKRKCQ